MRVKNAKARPPPRYPGSSRRRWIGALSAVCRGKPQPVSCDDVAPCVGASSGVVSSDAIATECVNNFETPVAGSLVSNAVLPRLGAAWVLEG